MPESTRAYLYRVAVAVVPLLVVLGYLTNDTAQLALDIAAAVLAVGGFGLAVKHTSTS